MSDEHKCSRCTNDKCCTYITQAISTPRNMADFDHLLWQISHRDIQIYQDEDGWFLLVNNPCTHLLEGGGCGIYAERPQICRGYSNDWCELDAPAENGFKRHYRNYAELLAYCRHRFKGWDKRFTR